MRSIRDAYVFQFGVGGVGCALLQKVLATRERLLRREGVRLNYLGLADSSGYLLHENGLSDARLAEVLSHKRAGRPLTGLSGAVAGGPEAAQEVVNRLRDVDGSCVIVDVTASQEIEHVLMEAAEFGCGIVLANKRPLVSSMDNYHRLMWGRRTRYEATVGAGLPVIHTVQYLLNTGDDISAISGSLSGTMGYLCARLEGGVPFSSALAEAKREGYTEPDPREDLGGIDVGRKALILARLLGWDMNLDEVRIESLYPADWDQLSVSEFLAASQELDEPFAERVAQAQARGEVLRYVAEVQNHSCQVGLRSVPAHSLLGSMRGTDNVIQISSMHYQRPLVICGAGAGVEVTAAAVLEDMIELALLCGKAGAS